MKKKIIIALAVMLIIGSSFAFAIEGIAPNAAGVYGMIWQGESGAGGLQYQRWFNHLGMQFTAGGIATSYDGKIQSADFAVLAELQGKLFSHVASPKFASVFYAWALGGFHGYTEVKSGDLYLKPNAVVGFGLGIEMIFVQHISFPIQFGYSGEFPNDLNFGFSFATGFRYRF